MIFDTITLTDGAKFVNLVIASGTTLPTGTEGELFYKTDEEKIFVSNGTSWQSINTELGFSPVDKAGDTMTGPLILSGDPSTALAATTKQYVDGIASGLSLKQSVRAATTANITLSGTQTIDGISVLVGDRVLVKNQTTASQNGIYIVSAGSWTRSTDADNSPVGEVVAGMFCFVSEGTTLADTGWVLVTNNSITLGTTALSFTQFSSAGGWTGGTVSNAVTITSVAPQLILGSAGVAGKLSAATRTALTISAGDLGGGFPGAALTLKGGDGDGGTAGGAVNITGGVQGGAINITAGGFAGSLGSGANVNITAGTGAQNVGTSGGSVIFNSGNGYAANGSIIFQSNSVERFRFLATGSISIGSAGNAFGAVGQALMSNGNAAPSWEAVGRLAVANTWTAANTWSAATAGSIATLTAGATVTPNFALSNNFKLSPVQNFTLAFPTNPTPGQSGLIIITQDSTGGRVVTWASGWVAAGGSKPVLSTASNTVDYISYFVETTSRIFVSIISSVS